MLKRVVGISALGGLTIAPKPHTSRNQHTPRKTHITKDTKHITPTPKAATKITAREGPPQPSTQTTPKRTKKKQQRSSKTPPKQAKFTPVLERVRQPHAELLEETGPFSSLHIPTNPELLNITHDQDKLGTLVQFLSAQFASASSWESFAKVAHGRPHLSETVHQLDHPASSLLAQFRDSGVPVVLDDKNWTREKLDECLARGAHQSAIKHKAFIREEMAECIEDGHWLVLPYHMVNDLPNLRLSPLGVEEERERRPRLVVDHSFYELNDHTQVSVPLAAMQFG